MVKRTLEYWGLMSSFPTPQSVQLDVERFLAAHPELNDSELNTRYPHCRAVVGSIDALADCQRVMEGRPIVYDELGISDAHGFIRLLGEGNERAIGLYKLTESTLFED